MSKHKEWRQTTLGEALPIRYGKARTDKAGIVREDSPVYGSSGVIGKFNRVLTSGPALIIGRKGTVGATYYSAEPSWPIDTVYFTEGSEGKDLRFFKYLLDHLQLGRMDRSTAIPGLSRDDYNAREVAVPAYDEQQLIVAEIEKQFTRLDAGVASLKRAQTALKRYRASVLQAACEGRLVPSEAKFARAEHKKFETGEALLARIRKVRDEKIRDGDIRRPRTLDASFLTELNETVPEGWALGRVEDFGALEDNAIVDGPFGSNLKLSDYTPDGKYPVITITNIDEGFDLGSLRKVTEEKFQEVKRSAVRAGDILVAKIGSSFGKTGIYPGDMPVGIIPANLLKISPSAEMNWKYLFYTLRSLTFKKHLDKIVQYTAQPAFNVSKFKLLPVPVPPLAEQTRIVAEVERRLSVVEELEATVSTNLHRATRLRQAVLRLAFHGQLRSPAPL